MAGEILGSLVRALLMFVAGFLVEHGIWTSEQVGRFVPYLTGGIVMGITVVGWALWRRYRSRILFLHALEAQPGTSEEVVKARAKLGGGRGVLGALILILLVPMLAQAQERPSLRSQAAALAKTMAPQQASAARADELDNVVTPTMLRFAEGGFVTGELSDALTTWILLGKHDANGTPIYDEGNPLLPNNRVAIVAIKVGAVAGGIVAAEKLWADGHRWQAVAVMATAGVVSFAAAGKNVYEAYLKGQPPPATAVARLR